MSSKNRRVFSLIALLLFVSLVCLADSAWAGKSENDQHTSFLYNYLLSAGFNANR
ncbi:MAG: hypothetical protein WC028_02205 [Candidatus Obscuribacterales bacterium]